MKKIILTTTVMLFTLMQIKAQQEKQTIVSVNYSSQEADLLKPGKVTFSVLNNTAYNEPTKGYDYYTRKKKNNLTAGVLTLGAGLAFSGIGWAVASNSTSFDNDETAAVLLIAGAASGIASIPLMIMATVYGHKAKVTLDSQKTGFGVPSNVSKSITGITMSFPIGK